MLYVIFSLLILLWSYTAIVTKLALSYIGPFEFTFWRICVGFLSLFLIAFFSGKIQKPKSLMWAFLLGFFQNALPVIFYNLALVYSSAGKVTVLGYMMPFWNILFERFLLKTKFSKLNYLPMILSFFGLILIMQPWQFRSSVLGYAFAILYGISWGLGNIISVFIWKKYPTWDSLSLTFWQMVFVFLIVSICFLFSSLKLKPIIISNYLIFAIFYTGVASTAFGWFFWILLLKKLPLNILSLSSLAIPVFAMLESYLQLNEKFSKLDLIGSSLIILSLLMVYRKSYIKRKKNLPQIS